MASYVNSTSANNGTGGSNLSLSTSIDADVYVLSVSVRDTAAQITNPTGWTLILTSDGISGLATKTYWAKKADITSWNGTVVIGGTGTKAAATLIGINGTRNSAPTAAETEGRPIFMSVDVQYYGHGTFNSATGVDLLLTGYAHSNSIAVAPFDYPVPSAGTTVTTAGGGSQNVRVSTAYRILTSPVTGVGSFTVTWGGTAADNAGHHVFLSDIATVRGQAQATVISKFSVVANALSQIIIKASFVANAQAKIIIKVSSFANSLATIITGVTTPRFAQAQTSIKVVSSSFGSSNALIVTNVIKNGQSLSVIGRTDNLYSAIDEVSASDSDYIITDETTGSKFVEIKLGPLSTPGWAIDHVLRARIAVNGSLTMQLWNGIGSSVAILYVTKTNFIFEDYTLQLNSTQISNIVDYSDLRIVVNITGKAAISWVEFSVPNSNTVVTYQSAQAGAKIVIVTRSTGQSRTSILQSYRQVAQSAAHLLVVNNTQTGLSSANILSERNNVYGQTLGSILTAGYSSANAQTSVKTAYVITSQAQGSVLATYSVSGQAQATVRGNTFGLVLAKIQQAYYATGLASARILIIEDVYGNAQSIVVTSNVVFGNALASIQTSTSESGLGMALIYEPVYLAPISDTSNNGWIRVMR